MAAIIRAMATFDDFCSDGNEADALLLQQQFAPAQAAYYDLLERAHAASVLDSFLLAKATLSLLLTHVRAEDIAGAHKLWTAPEGSLLGQGIHFLETGQTSVDDLMLYFLISAHLQSFGTDRQAALSGVQDQISRVARYAQQEAPALLPTVIGNWRAHLEQIFEMPLAQVPPEACRAHKEFAASVGPLNIPAELSFPRPSPWQIDWDSAPTTDGQNSSASSATESAPAPTPAAGSVGAGQSIESQMDQVDALIKSQDFGQALKAARGAKAQMLRETPCDPSILGWVMFFEFKCLYSLREYDAALAQAEEALDVPYVLSSNNSAYRASVCTELAVRCNKPVDDIVTHAKAAFEERSRGGNPAYTLQSLQTACNLLEIRDAEDQAEFFARKMIELGTTHGSDVAVLKGFLTLMRGALRAGRDADLRPLVDELLGALRPLDKSEKRADLMGQVSMLESTRSPLASNRAKLERFLAS